jgi:DNA-binding IclR family transcriptional regulator
MARYFFHIEGEKPHRDEIGEDLPDDEGAWRAAVKLARDVEDNLRPGQTWHLDVRDGDEPVYIVAITTRRQR